MRTNRRKNEKGFAMMESVVFMIIFVFLAGYCVDFFTIIHTGILQSTAARTYLFETLEHRSYIDMLRQSDELPESQYDHHLRFASKHYRFHATADEDQSSSDNDGAKASGRTIGSADDVSRQFGQPGDLQSQENQTKVVQIRTGYGICLDSGCPQ
jgi:hypothetical protein